jgi:predicted dehydrogenase
MQYRIGVAVWLVLCPVVGQYIVRDKNLRMVWHYLGRVGPRAVLRKIRSRLKEGERNQKVAAIGVGEVLEAPGGAPFGAGQRVLFFAPNHPRRTGRVVIDPRFVVAWSDERWTSPVDKTVVFDPAEGLVIPEVLDAYIGWSPFSGLPVNDQAVREALISLRGELEGWLTKSGAPTGLISRISDPICEYTCPSDQVAGSETRTSVLFGLGNYAKTQIIPNLHGALKLTCIHEVDPLQIGPRTRWRQWLDTSPWPREDERYDAWFIAGFHHTHTPLAVHALQQGAYAVVEKPIATTWDQLNELRRCLESLEEKRLFACFHKRHSLFNNWVRADLTVPAGAPVNYHCIVYEIPLPPRHWYNWPNSRSRLTSNGCHWLDHFMFLNDYSPVRNSGLWRAENGGLTVFVELENKAAFTMTLTDVGSERLGVREYIELHAGNVTVRMVDGSSYEAESTSKVIRRRRVNPMNAYRLMYRSISRSIVEGASGDPLESLRSTELMLSLEDELTRTVQSSPSVRD